jgi:antitoxin ParD1/3/4
MCDENEREKVVRARDRQRLRNLLLEGAASPQGEPIDEAYFVKLRERIRVGRISKA